MMLGSSSKLESMESSRGIEFEADVVGKFLEALGEVPKATLLADGKSEEVTVGSTFPSAPGTNEG